MRWLLQRKFKLFREQTGFTLIEVLVVMAVGGILMTGLVLSIYNVVWGTSRSNSQGIVLTDVNRAAWHITKDLQMANSTGMTVEESVVLSPENSVTLRWTEAELPGGQVSIAAGQTRVLTFWARATKDVSGSYYNEVMVISDVHAPTIFTEIGVSDEEYYACYSWNAGTVIVPAYDSLAEADGATVDANMSLILGGVTITSWQVK